MKILFLDDSLQREKKIHGLGGFVVEADALRHMGDEFRALKTEAGIPTSVEIKWSPPPNHFLRTDFTGIREDLYRSAIRILARNHAEVVCAIHILGECYGITLHNWTLQRAVSWAKTDQFRFVMERFQRPCLTRDNSLGMVICDEAGSRDEDEDRLEEFELDFEVGTDFQQLDRIVSVPIPARSRFVPYLQLADVVVGVVSGAVAGGRYGRALFNDVGPLFLRCPLDHPNVVSSTPSGAVLGFGLKFFPTEQTENFRPLFQELDQTMIVTRRGIEMCS
jgi:hypothetical protein